MKISGNFIFLLSILLLSGCVSFSGDKLPTIENIATEHGTFAEATAKKVNIAYSYQYERTPVHKDKTRFQDEFVTIFDEYGHLSLVDAGTTSAEQAPLVKVEVQLVDSITDAAVFSAFLACLTVDTLPTWETRTYTINARVTSIKGEVYKYQLVDSMKTVRWLPLFIATPMKNMYSVGEKIRKNMWRNLILKIQEDKLFPDR